MLPSSGRLACICPHPRGVFSLLAQPHPTTLLELTKINAPKPRTLRRGLSSRAISPFPLTGSRKSCTRIWGRLWQVPPLPARAEKTLLSGHGEPRRGGLSAPRILPSTARGHLDGRTRARPQKLPKARPGVGVCASPRFGQKALRHLHLSKKINARQLQKETHC